MSTRSKGRHASKCLVWMLPLLAVSAAGCAPSKATVEAGPEAEYYIDRGERPYDFRQGLLKNGLRIITLEDHSCPVVAVQMWYHVGSKDEDAKRQGFAHLFEHMMFRGTDLLGPEDHADLVQSVGGHTTAFTWFDATYYWTEVPSNQLDLALWLEAERMVFLRIDEQNFHVERKVVEEERRQSLDAPYGRNHERIMAGIFKEHPYRWSSIGRIPHLRAATLGELEAFWSKFYVPNNAVLVIVGDVDHVKAQQLAKKYFAWIPQCPDPPRVKVREPPQKTARDLRIPEERGSMPIVGVVVRTVPEGHADIVPLEALVRILAGKQGSRLYADLMWDKAVADSVYPFMMLNLEHHGLAGVAAKILPEANSEGVMQDIEGHLDALMKTGVKEGELSRTKNRMLRDAYSRSLTVGQKAYLLGQAALLAGDPERVNKHLAEIRAVTAADLQRVVRKYFAPERRNRVFVEPGASRGDGDNAEGEGTVPPPSPRAQNRVAPRTGPKAAAKRPPHFPTRPPLHPLLEGLPEPPQIRHRLENGLEVVVVPNHEVPLVTISLGIKYGSYAEDPNKPGVADMTLSMLSRGTRQHTTAELLSELERDAISLYSSAGHDTSSLRATCLAEKLPLALELLAESALQPAFRQEQLDLMRKMKIRTLRRDEGKARQVATREMARRLYGSHPYARRTTGEIEDMQRITREDLVNWWRRFSRPNAAILYVAGDVKSTEVLRLAKEYLGDWKAEGDEPKIELPALPKSKKTHIVLVDRPGSTQSEIHAGHLSFTRSHADWHTSRLLSHILGFGPTSRLSESLRQRKGLTYLVSGEFDASRFAGTFYIRTFTQTSRTAEAIRVIQETLTKMRTEPPTAVEMETTLSNIVGGLAGRWETAQAVVADLWLIDSLELSPHHIHEAIRAYSATKAKDVQRVAKEHIRPDRLTIVVVGDASRIREDLEKIAPVEVVRD